jgi:hypothetical protein
LTALDEGGPADRPYRPFPDAWLERSAAAIFVEVAARDPGKVAVDDGARALTYGGLERLGSPARSRPACARCRRAIAGGGRSA